MLKLIENKTIRKGIFDNYVYSPIKNVVTFGYDQSSEEQMQEKEEESLKNFNNYRDQYNEKAKDPNYQEDINKYPGYDQS